jgi:HK97 family phage prohead protease
VRLSGYGSVFYREGDPSTEYRMDLPWGETIIERIMATAFDGVLRSADCACLYNHDPNFVLARTGSGTLRLSVDRVGLFYEATLDRASPATATVLSAVARGDVFTSSFSFDFGDLTWKETKDANGKDVLICQVDSVAALYDVCPVYRAAYSGTSCKVSDGERSARSAPFAVTPGRRWPKSFTLPARPDIRRRLVQARLAELDL